LNSISGINQQSKSFYVEDYSVYDKQVKMLRRYKELKRKDQKRELAEN
jgi:hypothetical protein